MKRPDSISKSESPLKSMQFTTLLKQGIAHCQQLGGEMWTDFNEHDPGMTILEQLCYAITEAGYRADLPVPDLLAQELSTPATTPRDTLLTGDVILTSAPVTVDDYRKLLYDRVRNLHSVWVTREDSVQFGPLFHVRIETGGKEEQESDVATARLRVLQAARGVLGAHRNLGEDFASVELLIPFKLAVSGVIDVEPDAVPTDVLAEVLLAIQRMLVPVTSVTSVGELVRNGSAYDEIFNGPFTAVGSISDSALPMLKRSVTVEEIAGCIAAVAGVARVRELGVTADGHATPTSSGQIAIPDDRVARLEPSVFKPLADGENYRIRVSRNGAPYPLERARVYQHIERQIAALKNQEIVSAEQMRNAPYRKVKKGMYRQVERYYSLQHQLPRTYGMSLEGVPLQGLEAPARLQRTMQARQLKAFLLIFDQVLSDCFGQLGNLWQLFSLDQTVGASYFGQPLAGEQLNADEPAHLRDWNLLRDSARTTPEPLPYRRTEDGSDFSRHRAALAAIWHKHDDFIERRNHFLDHLLARFGERFDDVALASFDPRLHGDKDGFYHDLINWKIAFLHHCAGLGSGRNQAYDYRLHRALSIGARSGLELRLFCLLGLLGAGGWHTAGAKAKIGGPPFLLWRGQAPSHSNAHAAGTEFFTFQSSQPALFLALLKHGIVRGNYTIEPLGRHYRGDHHDHHRQYGNDDDSRVEVLFSGADCTRHVVHVARSVELAKREIARMIAYFGTYLDRHPLYAGEEMLLIEHVLLRPTKSPMAPAHDVDTDSRGDGDKNIAHGASTDTDGEFYPFRLSLFFPDWPLRFQNPDFRAFAVRTIAQNCPSHLAAQCYWIDAQAMRRLHRRHGNWMARKQAVEGDAGQQAGAARRHDAIIALNRAATALRRFIRHLDAGAQH